MPAATPSPRTRRSPAPRTGRPRRDLPLISAYGLFWERDEHEFKAPRGSTYQMLGLIGGDRTLRVCDFRRARGVYILYNDFGPTYAGRARGQEGFGDRLKRHDKDPEKDWTRFCWYSFDPIVEWPDHNKWMQRVADDGASTVRSASAAIDELEALMITAFGLKSQNQMKLAGGEPWRQATHQDCAPGRPLTKVARSPIRDTELCWYLDNLNAD